MILDTTQAATLKTFIEANPTWMALPHNSDGAFQIAEELTFVAVPDFIVWRTSVTEMEFTNEESSEGTNWDWSAYISRSVGERDGFARMFKDGFVNAAKPNIRQGFIDIFSGGTGVAQRTHMAAIAKRKANVLEKLFAVGTGSTASPATMVIEGVITRQELAQVMGW